MYNHVIVLGNSSGWSGDNIIAHGVMRDAIDLPSLIGVLRGMDFTLTGQLEEAAASRACQSRGIPQRNDPRGPPHYGGPLLHHYPVSTEPEELWGHGNVMLGFHAEERLIQKLPQDFADKVV